MLTQRTVEEILEGRKEDEEVDRLRKSGALLLDGKFEEEEPYTAALEKMMWEDLESHGINPEDYPDKTLPQLIDAMQSILRERGEG